MQRVSPIEEALPDVIVELVAQDLDQAVLEPGLAARACRQRLHVGGERRDLLPQIQAHAVRDQTAAPANPRRLGRGALTLPSTPIAWANRLSAVLAATLGNDRFPVDVEQLAIEYTRQVFGDPVSKVVGEPLDNFEGALFPSPSGKPRWLIVYNSALTSEGRIRYTQAHELGHYLLHREPGQSIRCRARDMLIWDPAYEWREAEANQFASYIWMPLDDYRRQADHRTVDLNVLSSCADRHGVSLTAAILKWLEFTPGLAVLVVSCDGFIQWASSSKPALRKGAFFRTRNRPPLPVPEGTLAAQPGGYFNPDRTDHPCGVWFRDFAATEFAVISERYDMTLSLLLLREGEA